MTRSLTIPLLTFLAACATVDDPVPATALPANYQTGGDGPEAASEPVDPDRRWWLAMNDPQLTAAIEASLAQNLSIASRRAQILQAEAMVDQARAGRFPQVRLNGNVGFSRSVGAFGSITSQNASVSVPVSYELDLFARYARSHQAAEREMEATVEDFRAAQIATSAQVAEAFYDAVFARARVAVLTTQVEVNEQFLELVMLRFREGLVASLDVHQQRQQTLAAKANLELAQGEVVLAEQQLAALLGTPSLDPALAPTGRTELPELGPAPAPGVPGALLDQRPDVRAARKRIEAADRRVASAIAARLPSIRLNVTPGYTWNRNEFGSDSPIGGGMPNVSSGWTFNAGATLDMPLFDGFATRAQVDVNSAQLQVQIETLQNLVITALIEVESSLVREKQLRRNVEILQSQVDVAEETLEAARERYRSGLSDFLPVLTAIQSSQSAELAVLQAQRNLLSARIQLYRALGGTWPEDVELAPPPSEIREEDR